MSPGHRLEVVPSSHFVREFADDHPIVIDGQRSGVRTPREMNDRAFAIPQQKAMVRSICIGVHGVPPETFGYR
jgi:hypothetical protein